MLHSLGGPSITAVSVSDIWYPSLIEVISKPYLSCAHLYDHCAKALVYSQDLLCWAWCQLI